MSHLLDIASLEKDVISSILERSRVLRGDKNPPKVLSGKIVANLFFETSTRTRSSFTVAGENLGARVLALDLQTSSVSKGETLLDTVKALEAMGVSAFVIRHSESGAPHFAAKRTSAFVINAGDGRHEHPTQALLDARTILDKKGRLEGLTVAIAGDVSHSRVARSNIHLLGKFGAKVNVAAPLTLMPRGLESFGPHVHCFHRVEEALEDADVVMMLRVQTERIEEALFPSRPDYHRAFGLTKARFALAKPDAIVMHPGPINRGVEIANEVADGPGNVILDEVANGVFVRMAVLEHLFSEPLA